MHMVRFAHLEWPFFDAAHRRLAREAEAWARDVGKRRITRKAATSRMQATESALRVIDTAVPIFGGLVLKESAQ